MDDPPRLPAPGAATARGPAGFDAGSIPPGTDVAAFLDRFAARVARAYHRGELPYAVCDSIVGDLWGLLQGLWMDGVAHDWPMLFQQVYDAFEAGAWHRRADGSDDPVGTYTDPAIAAIIAALDRADAAR